MSELKLLNCPFCGGEAKLNYFGDKSHIPFYQMHCIECGCKQSNSIHKESVVNAWNTRTPMANIVEKLEDKYNNIPFQYETNYEDGFSDGLLEAINIVKREINKGLE